MMSLLKNGLFIKILCYVKNFILGRVTMPVLKFFAYLGFERKSSFYQRP